MNDKAVVLIVDDMVSNIQVLALNLEEQYFVKVATSGARALELAMQDPIPDLILLDIEMPVMDGYQVIHKLKKEKITMHIPVIFITGKTDTQDEERGFLLGAVDYIRKPINPVIVNIRVHTQITLKLQKDELRYMAVHDRLSGLYNRHYLAEAANSMFSSAKRHKEELSVIMCDIDHFKAVNDTHGHIAGDKVIQAMSSILLKCPRSEDIAARYGGEEFVIVLWKCNAEAAKVKAEEIRIAVSELDIDGIRVTSSFGIAEFKGVEKNFEELLKNADAALYKAKESGRNKTIIY